MSYTQRELKALYEQQQSDTTGSEVQKDLLEKVRRRLGEKVDTPEVGTITDLKTGEIIYFMKGAR